MVNIQTIEPEFDADYIGDAGTADVINELRLKINELINAHNAAEATRVADARHTLGRAAGAAPGPHRPGGFPAGGGRKTRRKRGRTRHGTRRRRKRRY